MPAPSLSDIQDRLKDLKQTFVPFLAKYYAVTTEYGAPTAKGPTKGTPHEAVDYGAPKGTHLYSPGTGLVLNASDNPDHVTSSGGANDDHTLTVDYGNGIIMTFAHLDKIFVKPGDMIAEGDYVADTGNFGVSTGAHLHVESWQNGKHIDPRTLFDPSTHFSDYEQHPGATAGSIPILGPLTGGARGAADMGTAIVGFIAALMNPETWARIFAIIGGAILTMVGGYMLWQST